jgi:RHS repeat-associated protein
MSNPVAKMCNQAGHYVNAAAWSACVVLLTSICALPFPTSAQGQSAVYGYTTAGPSFNSLEDAEAWTRSNYQMSVLDTTAGYPTPVSGNFEWTLLVQPLGSIDWQPHSPPEEWADPYYLLTPPPGGSWPPTVVDPTCTAINTQCTPATWCPSLATEISRVTCEINATYPPNHLCLQGTVQALGAYPAPWVPTGYSAISLPDPSGQDREGGSFDYITSNLAQTEYLQAATVACGAMAGINSPATVAPSPPLPGGPSPNSWGLGQKRFYFCSTGGTSNPSNGTLTACGYGPFKKGINPFLFKQDPTAGCPKEGNPCGVGNGNKSVEEFDFSTGNIAFHRTYNSLRELKPYSFIDKNWAATFSQRIQTSANTGGHANSDKWIAVQNESGLADVFYSDEGINWTHRSLTQRDAVLYYLNGDPLPWVEVFPDGHTNVFDDFGRLRRIDYPDDERRSLSFTYLIDGTSSPLNYRSYAIDIVTDAMGRGIQFEYAESHDPPVVTDFQVRVVGIKAYPSGDSLVAYDYDDASRLAAVTMGTATRTYNYAEAGYVTAANQIYDLTSIIDENGAAYASYWYDDYGRVTRSEHAGGAGEVDLNYISDTAVAVTRASGEVVNYQFRDPTDPATNDVWRRPQSITDGASNTSSTLLNSDSACPVGLGNPQDERICQETDRRGVVKQYEYSTSSNAGLFTTAVNEGVGQPNFVPRRTETDRYDRTYNYRVKERRTFRGIDTNKVLEAKTEWTYNARSQIAARCEIDPLDTPAMNYACSDTIAPPPGARVRRWTYTYCEQTDVTAGHCPAIGLLVQVNGPRPANSDGMVGYDDTTSYSYYMGTDESGCGTSAGPCHRTGDLWHVTNAISQSTESTTYDSEGRVVRQQDANGTYTDFTYHTRGWLLTRTVRANANGSPSSNDATTTIAYDAVGNVQQVTQPDGAYLHYDYDDAHRLTDIRDNLNNHVHYTLDASGNRTDEKTYDPLNVLSRELSRSYDSMNRLYQTLNAAGLPTQTYPAGAGYDANGNPVLSTDGLGYSTQQTYDPLNRLVKTLQNYNGTDLATRNTETDYTYDTRDNLLTVQDPSTYITTYEYDGLNNLTSLQSPDTGLTSPYVSDLSGNRTEQTDARGKKTTYTYDALNRLLTISYLTPSLNVGYSYDQINAVTGCTTSYPIGRLTTMTDSSGTTTYCYDRRGNVTQKRQIQTSATLTTGYTYSKADRLMSVTYPGGSVTAYTRDSTGHITQVKWSSLPPAMTPVVSNVTYYPFGPAKAVTFNNGRIETKNYDTDYAIDQITSSAAGGLTLDLRVDQMGDVTSASATIGPPTPDRKYTYDALYRLTNVQTGANIPLETYTYNKTGDRTSASLNGGAAQAYTYTPNTHWLANVAGSARSYDANGNTTTANGTTFTYDDRNRLSKAGTAIYTYNGKGERVAKKSAAQNSLFVYDEGGRLLGEYTNAGAPLQTFLWMDDALVGIRQGSATYYVETDHLGTPRNVVDPTTNNAVWTWTLLGNAFGTDNPIASSFSLNLRYPGQYYDSENGWNYSLFRNYEPPSGRYGESDPIGLGGGITTYGYAGLSPLMGVDPSGLAQGFPSPTPQPPPGLRPPPNIGPVPNPGGSANSNRYFRPSLALCLENPIACAAIVCIVGITVPNSTSSCDQPHPPPDNNCPTRPDCTKASPWQLARANILEAHAFKDEYDARPNSRFDICACSDGTIVIKENGMCGSPGPSIPTYATWK